MEITRRNLLKWVCFLTAGFALPKAIKAAVLTPKEKPLPKPASEAAVPALCKLCPALCMLQIRAVNGKPVGVSGMRGHPMNQGSLCPKGGAALQDLYHPDRLRRPLKRKGDRGSNRWEPISWVEAHRLLSSKLSDLLARKKPEALGILAAPRRDMRHEIQKRFARAFGTPHYWEWNWALGQLPLDAFERMHGFSEGLFYDLANANLVVSFEWDWLQAFPSPIEAQRSFAELRRGRPEKRARILQIEPRLSTTAGKADEWIAIKPGTEGALAMGVAHVLIREGLYDKNFVARWTSGFEEFRKVVLNQYPPERVSEQTGAKRTQIDQIAREMASVKPALAIANRTSLFNQLAIHSLNALVGSIGDHGVLASEAHRYQLALPPTTLPEPPAALLPGPHQIPEAILGANSPLLEVLWLENVNPVFLSPQPSQWRKALERIPFIVSFASFMDETSRLADLVLPIHASLESWQDGFSLTLQGQGVVSFAPPVMPPLYGTEDHGDVLLRLARSLGGRIASAMPWDRFTTSLEQAADRSNTRETMRRGEWLEYEGTQRGVPATLKTKSRKLEFPTAEVNPGRAPDRSQDRSHPLHLYLHVPLAFSFGEGAHLPYLHTLAGAHLGEQWESWIEIHPDAARKRGLSDGQMVWVESSLGRIKVRARHYEGIRPDTVSLPLGLGHTDMGRYAKGIGTNPAEIVPRVIDVSGQPLWQCAEVAVYAA